MICSILFPGREYIPFLPSPQYTPQGPVDPPLFDEEAPDGWWADQAMDLFSSATCITNLLAELDDEDAALYTPFAGFCNFSAATMNVYVLSFPMMNLGRTCDTARTVDINLKYLAQFRGIWPIGQGWWTAIPHTKALYERRSQDPRRYHGKTRDDFEDLEASMHDTTGRSPSCVELPPSVGPRPFDADCSGNDMDLAQQTDGGESGDPHFFHPSHLEDWSHDWPLWGELHNVPFNHNLDSLL